MAGPDAIPRVSVIIPHYQMPDALRRCLDSVLAQELDGPGEVIVVDNNSQHFPDDVAADYPQVRFLSEPRPGPGLARNTGVAAARAEILAFIDADCWAEKGWLQAAVSAVAADPEETAVGGDVRIGFINSKRLTSLEAYEAVFAYRQKFYIEKKHFSGTGNLAMTKAIHTAVGPFAGIDTAEDQDWGRRAFAAGIRTRYVPAMCIYHPARTTMAELERKWRRHIAHELHDHRAAGRTGNGRRGQRPSCSLFPYTGCACSLAIACRALATGSRASACWRGSACSGRRKCSAQRGGRPFRAACTGRRRDGDHGS